MGEASKRAPEPGTLDLVMAAEHACINEYAAALEALEQAKPTEPACPLRPLAELTLEPDDAPRKRRAMALARPDDVALLRAHLNAAIQDARQTGLSRYQAINWVAKHLSKITRNDISDHYIHEFVNPQRHDRPRCLRLVRVLAKALAELQASTSHE